MPEAIIKTLADRLVGKRFKTGTSLVLPREMFSTCPPHSIQ